MVSKSRVGAPFLSQIAAMKLRCLWFSAMPSQMSWCVSHSHPRNIFIERTLNQEDRTRTNEVKTERHTKKRFAFNLFTAIISSMSSFHLRAASNSSTNCVASRSHIHPTTVILDWTMADDVRWATKCLRALLHYYMIMFKTES